MGEVIDFDGVTRLDIEPDRVLAKAREHRLETALVLGLDEGGEFYFAASQAGTPENLWLLQKAIWELMKMEDRIAEEGLPGST